MMSKLHMHSGKLLLARRKAAGFKHMMHFDLSYLVLPLLAKGAQLAKGVG